MEKGEKIVDRPLEGQAHSLVLYGVIIKQLPNYNLEKKHQHRIKRHWSSNGHGREVMD